MCGLAGFYNHNSDKDIAARARLAENMANSLRHRGPDAGSIWCDPQAPLALAHRRLSILDLSSAGAQPMESPSARFVMVFNGEIYNFRVLRKTCEQAGHVFRGQSDSEVILALVEQYGFEKTVPLLNGMFAIVIWDRQEKILHFARDRFGKKPLYIGWCGRDLVFASELKAFHRHPAFDKTLSDVALAQFFQYGYCAAPYTIFKTIVQLSPAHSLSLPMGGDRIHAPQNLMSLMTPYWSVQQSVAAGQATLITDEAEALAGFQSLLSNAVEERMVADVPLGAFLSGGIDSATVVSIMQQQSSQAVRTFSIGFEQSAFDEAPFARQIAAHLGTQHQEYRLSAQDALAVIPHLPVMFDEPFADSSQIPTYLVAQAARAQVTVALTGDGGDEILGGYDRHTKIAPLWERVKILPHALRAPMMQGLSALIPTHHEKSAKMARAIFLMGAKTDHELYHRLLSFNDSGISLLENQGAGAAPDFDWPESLSFAGKMMMGDQVWYRPHDLMVKADRTSMAASLEARAPLMDYQLAEYCWRLPDSMKIRGGKGKWLLRQVLKQYVPESLFDRPKMGFSVPLADWLRGELKDWAASLMVTPHEGLSTARVQERWAQFQKSNSRQVPKDIWAVLMFQSWVKEWIEK